MPSSTLHHKLPPQVWFITKQARRDAHSMRWMSRAMAVAIIAILVTGLAYTVNTRSLDNIHAAQLKACERGNNLRRELADNHRALKMALIEARRLLVYSASLSPALRESNLHASKVYARLLKEFVPIAQTDCKAVIPSP